MPSYYRPTRFDFNAPITSGAAGQQAGMAWAQMQLHRQQLAEEERKRNELARILSEAYEPGAPERDLEGPPEESGKTAGTIPARPAGLNMENAMAAAAKSGRLADVLKMQADMEAGQSKRMLDYAQAKKAMQPNLTIGEIGSGQDKVQSVVFDPGSGRMIPVGDPRRKSSMPDWMMPGYIDAQRKLAEVKGEGRMSPTAQKELFEADETMQSASNVIGLLNKAKEINSGAYYGPMASGRAKVISLLPGENEKADKTIDLDNIMTGQALESLKLIFGGMPTEGERRILLDMQASVDKTPKQREEILNRAIEIANRRLEFNKSKSQGLRSGTYFKEQPKISEPVIGNKKYQIGEVITNKHGARALVRSIGEDGTPELVPIK